MPSSRFVLGTKEKSMLASAVEDWLSGHYSEKHPDEDFPFMERLLEKLRAEGW